MCITLYYINNDNKYFYIKLIPLINDYLLTFH